MTERDAFPEFLLTVKASTQRPKRRYRRLPGWFAIHGPVPPRWRASVQFLLNDGQIAGCRGDPSPEEVSAHGGSWTPVYSLEPSGSPAVPTGLVFIRFAEGGRAEEHREALELAGYTVVEGPPYAPHAVWVRASQGGIADSLARLPQLEAIPEIVSAEPQMLSESVAR